MLTKLTGYNLRCVSDSSETTLVADPPRCNYTTGTDADLLKNTQVRVKLAYFAPHMDESNVDFAPHMEGGHADFAPHMELRHRFRDQKIVKNFQFCQFL